MITSLLRLESENTFLPRVGGGGGGRGRFTPPDCMRHCIALRSAYTGRLKLPADLSHATRMNMGKSSVIV